MQSHSSDMHRGSNCFLVPEISILCIGHSLLDQFIHLRFALKNTITAGECAGERGQEWLVFPSYPTPLTTLHRPSP